LVSDAPDIAGRAAGNLASAIVPVKFPEVKEVSDAPDIAGRAPVSLLEAIPVARSSFVTDASGRPPATTPVMVPAPSIVMAI
jgi:hypothetical protein